MANYRKGRRSHDAPIEPAAREEVIEIVKEASAVESGVDRVTPKEQVVHKATSRLAALFDDDGPISERNLKSLKPREGISAAKDRAAVIDRVSPKGPGDEMRVQVQVFAPRMREEKEYEAIEVTARDIS